MLYDVHEGCGIPPLQTGVVEIDFSLGARIQCMVTQGSLLVAGLSNGFIHLIDLQVSFRRSA